MKEFICNTPWLFYTILVGAFYGLYCLIYNCKCAFDNNGGSFFPS